MYDTNPQNLWNSVYIRTFAVSRPRLFNGICCTCNLWSKIFHKVVFVVDLKANISKPYAGSESKYVHVINESPHCTDKSHKTATKLIVSRNSETPQFFFQFSST